MAVSYRVSPKIVRFEWRDTLTGKQLVAIAPDNSEAVVATIPTIP